MNHQQSAGFILKNSNALVTQLAEVLNKQPTIHQQKLVSAIIPPPSPHVKPTCQTNANSTTSGSSATLTTGSSSTFPSKGAGQSLTALPQIGRLNKADTYELKSLVANKDNTRTATSIQQQYVKSPVDHQEESVKTQVEHNNQKEEEIPVLPKQQSQYQELEAENPIHSKQQSQYQELEAENPILSKQQSQYQELEAEISILPKQQSQYQELIEPGTISAKQHKEDEINQPSFPSSFSSEGNQYQSPSPSPPLIASSEEKPSSLVPIEQIPKRPSLPFNAFVQTHFGQARSDHPDKSAAEINAVLSDLYRTLEKDEKNKMRADYREAIEEYNKRLLIIPPDDLTRLQTRAEELKIERRNLNSQLAYKRSKKQLAKKLEKPRLPKRPMWLYMDDYFRSHTKPKLMTDFFKTAERIWSGLPAEKKDEYQKRFDQNFAEYQRNTAAWKDRMRKNNFRSEMAHICAKNYNSAVKQLTDIRKSKLKREQSKEERQTRKAELEAKRLKRKEEVRLLRLGRKRTVKRFEQKKNKPAAEVQKSGGSSVSEYQKGYEDHEIGNQEEELKRQTEHLNAREAELTHRRRQSLTAGQCRLRHAAEKIQAESASKLDQKLKQTAVECKLEAAVRRRETLRQQEAQFKPSTVKNEVRQKLEGEKALLKQEFSAASAKALSAAMTDFRVEMDQKLTEERQRLRVENERLLDEKLKKLQQEAAVELQKAKETFLCEQSQKQPHNEPKAQKLDNEQKAMKKAARSYLSKRAAIDDERRLVLEKHEQRHRMFMHVREAVLEALRKEEREEEERKRSELNSLHAEQTEYQKNLTPNGSKVLRQHQRNKIKNQ